MSYIGNTPTTQNFIAGTDQFTGNGSSTSWTLSRFVNSSNDIEVVIANVIQNPTSYSVSGNTLTISPAVGNAVAFYVRYLSTTLQSVNSPQGVTTQFGSGAVSAPSITFSNDTNTGIYSPAADTIAFTEGGVESMRLDSSGNVGIGTSSPSARLDVVGDGLFQNPSGNRNIVIRSSSGNGSFISLASNGNAGFTNSFDIFQSSNGDGSLNNKNGPIIFLTGTGNTSAERARISAGGSLMLGTTSLISGTERFAMNYQSNTGPGLVIQDTTPQNGNTFIRFVNAGTVGGAITSNGGTTMTYGSASDYRLKENLTPLTGALEKVAALQPKVGNWKADGSEFVGFVAHELQEVFPDSVVGEKDKTDAEGNPEYQMVDTGSASIIATLTAAIQEQQQMIEELKAEVAALKGA